MSERILRLDPDGWDGDSLSITASRSVVGRGSDVDVLVAEPSISREHAVIHLGENGWEIEDAGSSQGTGVNWMKIDNGERI